MNSIKTWTDTTFEDSMPVLVGSIESRYSQRDSTREFLAGVEMVELDTVPAELLDYFK